MDYVLLLRGVNVGGKRKIQMKAQKITLEARGFHDVSTYINSGNILLSSDLRQPECIDALKKFFATYFFELDFALILAADYHAMIAAAPAWWGEQLDWRHNVAFVLAPYTANDLHDLAAQANTDYEQCEVSGDAIFWSSSFKTNYSKTAWSKLMKHDIYRYLTVRNRNTALKLDDLLQHKKRG